MDSAKLIVSALGINISAEGWVAILAAVVIVSIVVFGIRRRW
jgi:hypothetical protein